MQKFLKKILLLLLRPKFHLGTHSVYSFEQKIINNLLITQGVLRCSPGNVLYLPNVNLWWYSPGELMEMSSRSISGEITVWVLVTSHRRSLDDAQMHFEEAPGSPVGNSSRRTFGDVPHVNFWGYPPGEFLVMPDQVNLEMTARLTFGGEVLQVNMWWCSPGKLLEIFPDQFQEMSPKRTFDDIRRWTVQEVSSQENLWRCSSVKFQQMSPGALLVMPQVNFRRFHPDEILEMFTRWTFSETFWWYIGDFNKCLAYNISYRHKYFLFRYFMLLSY